MGLGYHSAHLFCLNYPLLTDVQEVFTRDSIICYSAYMLSPIRHRKTVEVRIIKLSPYGSPIPLVFARQGSSRNSKGFPERERQTREGWKNSAIFYL